MDSSVKQPLFPELGSSLCFRNNSSGSALLCLREVFNGHGMAYEYNFGFDGWW